MIHGKDEVALDSFKRTAAVVGELNVKVFLDPANPSVEEMILIDLTFSPVVVWKSQIR